MRAPQFVQLRLLFVTFGMAAAQFSSVPLQGQAAKSQQPLSAGAPSDKTPVFRSLSSVVTVNVVVTDRYNQPVSNLQARDFTVLEDGRPQSIRYFEQHWPTDKEASVAPLQLPPHQFTNFRDQYPTGVMNIVLFDMLNTPMMDQVYGRDQLLKFLRNIPQGQLVALFTLDSRLRMVQGFTDDPEKLLRAANMVHPGMTTQMASSEQQIRQQEAEARSLGDLSGAHFAQALADEESFRAGYRVEATVDAIAALSRAVAGYAGRKNLLWLSAGFPLYVGPDVNLPDPMRNVVRYQAQVNRLGIALASSEMAVYPIDVRGLVVNQLDASSRTDETLRDMSWLWSSHDTMREIANQTGGEAYYNTNGIREAMSRAADRGSHYYSLAYVPENRQWNGKYRSIKVKVAKQSLKLQYRRGYMALPEQQVAGDLALHLVSQAMQPGFPDSTMLFMKVQVLPPDAEHPTVRIDYAIPAKFLTFRDIPGKGKIASVDFVAVAWDKKGAQAELQAQGVDSPWRPESTRFGVAGHQEMRLKAGEYVLKIGAIDLTSQKIGTVEVPLVVPATLTSDKF
jgi:VWFA-related protein